VSQELEIIGGLFHLKREKVLIVYAIIQMEHMFKEAIIVNMMEGVVCKRWMIFQAI